MGFYLFIFSIAALLVSPYLLLLSQFSISFSLNPEDFFWALKNTLYQAFGSAFASVVLGILGGLGLIWLSRVTKKQTYFWIEKFILLPNMLPSLFVVVSCLGFIDPFPYGKVGIIIIHTIINIGLVSVMFSHICFQKLGSLGSLSLVEGASRWQFFKVGILGYLLPDLFYIGLFIFAIAMVSFNVPLLVGGTSGTTLEVLIYENLVINRNWPESISLSLIQMSIVGLASLLQRPSNLGMDSRDSEHVLELAEWKWGLAIPILTVGMVLLPPLLSFPQGLRQLEFLDFNWEMLISSVLKSLLLGLSTGGLLFLLGLGACWAHELGWWRRFMLFYLPPGAILVGFAFFILGQWVAVPVIFQIVVGLCIVFFAGLYRLSLASPLASLNRQIEVAQVMGASPFKIFRFVLLPPMLRSVVFVAGIGSMWACGDFALSSILSSEDFHLALIVKSLASSYRLDAAQSLMFILYLVSLGCFAFWWRLGDVLGRKLNH